MPPEPEDDQEPQPAPAQPDPQAIEDLDVPDEEKQAVQGGWIKSVMD